MSPRPLILATALLCTLCQTSEALAATFNVNSTADAVDASPGNGVCDDGAGNCTLRAAIQETNALGTADTINLPAGTYTLTIGGTGENASATGDLDVSDNLTLTGAGARSTVIDGNNVDRVFDISGGPIVTISGVTIQNGNASITDRNGGAILLGPSANISFTLTDSIIRANQGRTGGAISTAVMTTLTVLRCLFEGNSATKNGGAVSVSNGDAVLTNVTFSGNSATDNGGAFITGGDTPDAALINVTFTGNNASTGDDIVHGNRTLTVKNTIVASSVADSCSGSPTSLGYNIDIGNTCGFASIGDQINTDPQVGPLQNNGGPTDTHALLTASNAIDAVLAGCPPPGTDQRGVVRPLGTACDIGAYEASLTIKITKRAFQLDGTPIASGSSLPTGMPVKFLLYINNSAGLVADVSMQDVLDPLFLYVPESVKYDNSVAKCALEDCTAAEEAAIFAAADAGAAGTDAVDGDVVSFSGVTLDIGNGNVANAQLDIAGNKVWAAVFTIRIQ